MIKKAFSQTIQLKVWKYILGTTFAGTLAIFMFAKNFYSNKNIDTFTSALFGFAILVSIFCICFLYYLIIEIWNSFHDTYIDSIWGQAIVDLKEAYAIMHFLRKQATINDEDFKTALVTFCDTLKTIFDRKTKGDCCVSIKVPSGEFTSYETWVLSNLCRDTSHQDRDTDAYKSTTHSVIGNTPFSVIVSKLLKKGKIEKAYYLNNDIKNTKHYLNTSIALYKNGLPYNSELVHAILPIKNIDNQPYNLVGFLCIDCNKTNAFDEKRYDVPMVEGIVDGIYDIILRRNKQNQNII